MASRGTQCDAQTVSQVAQEGPRKPFRHPECSQRAPLGNHFGVIFKTFCMTWDMTSQGSSRQPNLRTERPSRHSKSINVFEKSVGILHKFVRTRLFEGQQMMILCSASNLALQATSFRSTSLDHPRSTRFGIMNVPFCFLSMSGHTRCRKWIPNCTKRLRDSQ